MSYLCLPLSTQSNATQCKPMHSFQPLAREDNLTRICTGEPASKPGGAVGLTIALLEFCAIASSQPSSQPSVDCGIRLLLIISSPLHSRCRAAEVWMESASRTEKRNKGARPSDRKSEDKKNRFQNLGGLRFEAREGSGLGSFSSWARSRWSRGWKTAPRSLKRPSEARGNRVRRGPPPQKNRR